MARITIQQKKLIHKRISLKLIHKRIFSAEVTATSIHGELISNSSPAPRESVKSHTQRSHTAFSEHTLCPCITRFCSVGVAIDHELVRHSGTCSSVSNHIRSALDRSVVIV